MEGRDLYLLRQREYQESVRRGDTKFLDLLDSIQECMEGIPKQLEIRIRRWVTKFCEPLSSTEWKRNRDAYAELLLNQLLQGDIRQPFDKLPSDGPLGTLSNHLKLYCVVPKERFRKMNLSEKQSMPDFSEKKPMHTSSLSDPSETKTMYTSRLSATRDVELENMERKLEDTLRKLAEKETQVVKLQMELANERSARQQEKSRLRQLHEIEISELIEQNAKKINKDFLPETIPIGEEGDDEEFLNYLDTFHEKATKMIKIK